MLILNYAQIIIKTNTIMRNLNRRQFLGTSAALIASVKTSHAASNTPAKTLKLYNTHTAETLFTAFEENGETVLENLQLFDFVLRDHRQNELRGMDPQLFYQLHELQTRLGVKSTIEIISGYRSPKTNAMLRRASSGVAKKSFHTMGRAIDIRIRGVKTAKVRDAAIKMNLGGVGYYSASDFVHLDTGPARAW